MMFVDSESEIAIRLVTPEIYPEYDSESTLLPLRPTLVIINCHLSIKTRNSRSSLIYIEETKYINCNINTKIL